jgi:hypothetical protein
MSRAIIDFALRTLKIKQKTLAKKLNVSVNDIQEWKDQHYMPEEKENLLYEMMNFKDRDPLLVIHAYSVENHDKWINLIDYMANEFLKLNEFQQYWKSLKEIRDNNLREFHWDIVEGLDNYNFYISDGFSDELTINHPDPDTSHNSYRVFIYSTIENKLINICKNKITYDNYLENHHREKLKFK